MQRSFFRIARCIVLITVVSQKLSAQTNTNSTEIPSPYDRILTVEQMQKDLQVFRDIREKTNSGLYRYRTKKQI
ncbi:MAG: hypothetical protein ABW036_01590, partial [Flavitalea sp.]